MLGFTRYDAAFFAALMSTAVALGASLAHLFELPNKIDLGRDAYFTVQGIYRGRNQLAYVLAIEFVSIIATIILSRDARQVRLWAVSHAAGAIFQLIAMTSLVIAALKRRSPAA